MTDDEILKFCTDEPATADSLIKALQLSIEFQRRMRMLRRLNLDPKLLELITKLSEDSKCQV